MLSHRSCALRLGGLLLTVVAPAHAQERASVTAFVNVAVIPMDRERVLAGQTVIVRGDRIVALGPTSRVPVPADAVRIDGRGKFLLPGLADMHVHLGESCPGGWCLPTKLDVADLLFTYVANGVTTVRDMHSGPPRDGEPWMPALRQRVARGDVLGPRIYAAGDPDGSSAAAADRSIAALKAAGYDFVKLYGSPRPNYDWIVAAAHRVGLPIVGHVPWGWDWPDTVYVGLPGVLRDHWASAEHLFGYFTAATGLGSASEWRDHPLPRVADTTLRRVARETQRAGLWNCPTLVTQVAMGEISSPESTDSSGIWEAAFYRRVIKALQDAGAGLLLGTDSGTTSEAYSLLLSGFGIHRELELLVEAGLTPYQALVTGTRNVAQFLGTLDSTGTVAVGKRADLVLLKANPLTDIRQTTALAGVMVGGRWLPRAELDRRIDTLRLAPNPQAKKADLERWGTMEAQMRLLHRVLWR